MLYYTVIGSNSTQVAQISAETFFIENTWLHVIITVDDGIIEFFLDGKRIPGGLKSIKGEGISDGELPYKIITYSVTFACFLQHFRFWFLGCNIWHFAL